MPGVYRLRCSACAFETRRHCAAMYVVLDDGTEQVCPHPSEAREAERLTGQSLASLRKADRLRYRSPCLCLACSQVEMYELQAASWSHAWAITATPPAGDTPCRACGARRLYPVYGRNAHWGCAPPLVTIVAFLIGVTFLFQGAFDLIRDRGAWRIIAAGVLFAITAALTWISYRLAVWQGRGPACPRCSVGRLRSEMTGIS